MCRRLLCLAAKALTTALLLRAVLRYLMCRRLLCLAAKALTTALLLRAVLRYLPRFSLSLSDVRVTHEPTSACLVLEGK